MKARKIRIAWALALLMSLVGYRSVSFGVLSSYFGTVSAEGAQTYPTGPITWVVPWKPGGANDICARVISPELEKILGVPVVITNTDGAGGWIGYGMVASAAPDGYTICNVSLPGLVNTYLDPAAKRNNTYRDFSMLINFARDFTAICSRPDESRFTNLKEMYEYSKKEELLIAGTAGAGDDAVLAASLSKLDDAKIVLLGTNGSSESLTNLYGSHVDLCIANVSEIAAPLAAGQVKILAVAAPNRVKQIPDVPTIKEAIGVDIVCDASRGIVTTAGVPEETLAVLRDALAKAVQSPNVKEKLASQGIFVEVTDWQGYTKIFQELEDRMRIYGPEFFGWDPETMKK
jgi:tripartite-type tricarboxylate transporter receptor subunit TctC